MKKYPLVSIIVPVYNAAEYIRKTIEMVQAQTFTDWELLLVDDGSKDNSEEVIKTYLKEKPDERIRLLKKEKNEGAALTRNRGIREAKGRYIAFLDDMQSNVKNPSLVLGKVMNLRQKRQFAEN